MIVSVHQPQYLPWLGFFDKIARSDCFVYLDTVQYKEREFQNRNKIRTSEDWIWLTVPVISKGLGRQRIDQVRVDNTSGWAQKHWESLKTCYGKAEFFKDHAQFFENLYLKQWEFLSALNVEIIEYVLKYLTINTAIRFESEIKTTQAKTGRIIEICKKLNADTYLSGSGGREYLEEEKFSENNIKLVYQEYHHSKYRQQFTKGIDDFKPYMSIVDLLFNEGPEARTILQS